MYIQIPKYKWHKMQEKVLTYIIVGVDDHTKGFRCFDLQPQSIIISRDVTYDKSQTVSMPNHLPTKCSSTFLYRFQITTHYPTIPNDRPATSRSSPNTPVVQPPNPHPTAHAPHHSSSSDLPLPHSIPSSSSPS